MISLILRQRYLQITIDNILCSISNLQVQEFWTDLLSLLLRLGKLFKVFIGKESKNYGLILLKMFQELFGLLGLKPSNFKKENMSIKNLFGKLLLKLVAADFAMEFFKKVNSKIVFLWECCFNFYIILEGGPEYKI